MVGSWNLVAWKEEELEEREAIEWPGGDSIQLWKRG
jgi:hypothetical protein